MPRILIVVVRYRTPLDQSSVMQSLAQAFSADPSLEQSFTTLVWDNSPDPLTNPVAAFPFEYRHTGENLGVSGAYNRAMELAEQRGDTWLLLLDQDTTLPSGLLEAMHTYAARLEGDRHVAAVAPSILMHQTLVSPKVTAKWSGARDFPAGFSGATSQEVVLVNTGLLLRVAALRQMGGFSEDFWLDFSDRYLCHMLAKHHFSVWIASELRLAHHISLMAGPGGMSELRYANLVAAEDAYFSLHKSFARNTVYCLRLLRNSLRERKAHPERARLLRRHLIRRFTVSKAQRLREWRASLPTAAQQKLNS